MGQYGIVEFKKIVGVLADVLNVIVKLIHGNFLAIFGLASAIGVLKDLNLDNFKKEIGELDALEREELEQVFISKLNFDDKVLQQKFIDLTDCLNLAIDIVNEGLAVVNSGIVLLNKVKAILGV